jgi:predicted nucleic acid-binding protein
VKVFFDANILIDVLANRQPHYANSAAVCTAAEERRIEGLVSAISFTTIFYVVRKLSDEATARTTLVLLRNAFTPVGCDARTMNLAIDSKIADFEDAVQYYSAVHANADCLLSRNPGDFPRSGECPVLTPAEFLAAHSFE